MSFDIVYDPEVAAHDIGFTLGQYLGEHGEFPMANLAYRYDHGKSLVRPEERRHVPTQMQRLHEWYMEASKEGNNWLVGIRDEHYFNGDDEMYIEFDELFQLYNQDALDKTIVSCYCL